MIDKVASVLDPLLDFVSSFIERVIHTIANTLDILFGDTKHRLRVV